MGKVRDDTLSIYEVIRDAAKDLVDAIIFQFLRVLAIEGIKLLISAITGIPLSGGSFAGTGRSTTFLNSLFGAQNGASFVVGGNAGIDNNLAFIPGAPGGNNGLFRIGRGERVDITPAGASRVGNVNNTTIIEVNIAGNGDENTVREGVDAALIDFEDRVANVNAYNNLNRPFR